MNTPWPREREVEKPKKLTPSQQRQRNIESAMTRLIAYVRHRDDCAVLRLTTPPGSCSCGLRAAWDELLDAHGVARDRS
jgi:hypothetical protein